ncbi:MAG: ATP-dependent dethiobiotin synthetase BioD, partial [Alphaproteobacteria bacterium]
MSALFIAGTGTGIGKTFIAAALARALRAAGRGVRVAKPVLSGFDESDWRASDSARLLDAVGIVP